MKGPHRELRDSIWARAWDAGLSSTQLLVALRLVEHWPNIFPGEKTVARWTRLGESTVREAIRQLVEARVLRVEREPGKVNHYWFLDREGQDIAQSFPDVGPTPPAASRVPRQQPAHPPPAASAPTPPAASAEADPDLKLKPKLERETGMPAVLHELPEGFVPSEELLSAAELGGCPRAVFLERLADLGTGPIGGTRGVSVGKLDAYLLVQAGKWKAWAAKAETPSRGSPAPRHGVITGKDDRGFPWTLEASEAHARYAEKHGLDLNEVLTEVQRRRVVETLGLGRAKEVIGELLTKRARAKGKAERERNTETGGRPDARDDRTLSRPRAAPQAG